MCRVLAAVVVLVAPSLAFADRSVTGTVVNEATGAPVAGALVAIGATEAASDAAGSFAIREAPFGRLDLIVIADGYKPYFGSARALRPLSHLMPAGKPAPPRPRTFAVLTSSMTCSGVMSKSALTNAE